MKILTDIENLISTTKCGSKHFCLDKKNFCINCLDKDALISCDEECGMITQITWLLIQNNINYTVTKDFNIILNT